MVEVDVLAVQKECVGILGCCWLFFFFITAFSLAKFKSYFQRDGMGEGTEVCFVPLEEKLILVIME